MKDLLKILMLLLLGLTIQQSKAQENLLSEDELLKKPIYTNLSKAFKEYDRVYRLRLKGSEGFYGKITAVHPKIDSLHHLQDFAVVNESLEDLPPAFGALKNLQFLSLSGNQFKALPDTLYSLVHLKRLDLQKNQLERISEKIADLKELEFLYLNENRSLKEIPQSAITRLKKLKYLNVQNTSIPRDILEQIRKALPNTQIDF